MKRHWCLALTMVLAVALGPLRAQTIESGSLAGITEVRVAAIAEGDSDDCDVDTNDIRRAASAGLLDQNIRVSNDSLVTLEVRVASMFVSGLTGTCVSFWDVNLSVPGSASVPYRSEPVVALVLLSSEAGLRQTSRAEHGVAVAQSVQGGAEGVALDIRLANQGR